MATRKTSSQNLFKPSYPIVFVSAEKTIDLQVDLIKNEKIGEKAFGLSCLPKSWTLPFIVISDELFSLYQCYPENDREALLKNWVNRICNAMLSGGIKDSDSIIVRSSGCAEGLTERGDLYSCQGLYTRISDLLAESLKELNSDNGLSNHKIPLIVQKYVTPISARGHLSNERRCYQDARDWLGEYEDIKPR